MTRMSAIYRRELSYFYSSPVAYVVIAVFVLLAGYFFYNLVAFFNMSSIQSMQNTSLHYCARFLHGNATRIAKLVRIVTVKKHLPPRQKP